MKRSLSQLIGYKIHASDGDLGTVDEFYFDDHRWTLRYLVAQTGSWLAERKVLISTAALKRPDWQSKTFPVKLTMDQVRHSPNINTARPVSRQHETDLHQYYVWPLYWAMGLEAYVEVEPAANNASLRSTQSVAGYHLQATDGDIGHVEDFIVDDETWTICYFVVNTRNWLPGKKVLIAPQWIDRVSWTESKVFVELSQEAVRNGPVYNSAKRVSRDYEGRLFDYYGRPKYWEQAQETESPHYLCTHCGRRFLSQIELRAHRKECYRRKKPKRRTPPAPAKSPGNIIDKIEDQRPEPWGGYRETDRSS